MVYFKHLTAGQYSMGSMQTSAAYQGVLQQDDSTTSTKKRGQNEEQNLKLADL